MPENKKTNKEIPKEGILPLGVTENENESEEEEEGDETPPPQIHRPAEEKRPSVSPEMTDRMALMMYDETVRSGFPTSKVLATMATFAEHCVLTGQMPKTIDSAAKAIMVFQAGRELGIPPIKSLQSMYFVNNKLTMYGPTVIERIRRFAVIEYGVCNSTEATLTIIRKDDGTELSARVTKKELEDRRQWKDVMNAHPETMLIYKAIGRIVRHICPEAVGALGVEGDVIVENETPAPRRGRVYDPVHDEDDGEKVIDVGEEEIPTIQEITKKYSLQFLQKRLTELEIPWDATQTKGMLAAHLVEALRAKQTLA